jgi:general L-amino acid transport system permease protein
LMVVATLGYFAARAVNVLPANAEARNWKIPQIPLYTFSSLRSRIPQSLSDPVRNVIAVVIFLILLIPFLIIWLINLVIAFLVREVQKFVVAKNKAAFIATRLWMILPIIFWILVAGIGVASMPFTDVSRWGGLLLTMILAAVGIVVSFPLGVLLALGRRSDLPVVRGVSTVYIEMVRGVPLITVLFMAQLLVPLINPDLAEVESIYRAMVGITLFSAAYLAENVRGGLQAVPPGQEEAAKALGLNPVLVLWFITLPQALRLVIPALVGQFISLFKDTSLVAIVGLIDFTGVARNVTGQTEFNGLQTETYVFLALIYFTFCYTMGVISRRIEASGSGAARRI